MRGRRATFSPHHDPAFEGVSDEVVLDLVRGPLGNDRPEAWWVATNVPSNQAARAEAKARNLL